MASRCDNTPELLLEERREEQPASQDSLPHGRAEADDDPYTCSPRKRRRRARCKTCQRPFYLYFFERQWIHKMETVFNCRK